MSMIKSLHQLGWFSRARFGREAPVPLTTHNRVYTCMISVSRAIIVSIKSVATYYKIARLSSLKLEPSSSLGMRKSFRRTLFMRSSISAGQLA